MNTKKIGIGVIIALVAVCGIGALLLGGVRNLFGGGGPDGGVTSSEGRLGDLFVAEAVDQNGCPRGETGQFSNDQTIYAGLDRSQIPAGTEMFMRLYHNGEPVEDSPEITADQDMNTCVWFEFSPSGSQGFDPGDYTAELVVNGNPSGEVAFDVSGMGIANTGGAQLGTLYTTTRVDQSGCATNDVELFNSNQPIYVSVDESFIPAGTELFARLNYEGEPVEDTDTLYAERDIQTCAWFVFEPVGGGFDPGRYSVDLFMNGQRVDSLPVTVR